MTSDACPQVEVTVDDLEQYLRKVDGPLCLIADVGATHCRLGLRPVGPSVLALRFVKVEVNSVKSFHDASTKFAARLGKDVTTRIVTACVSIPGPITHAGARGGPISNFSGPTPQEKVVLLEALPSVLFPKGRTTLLNDLEAGSYGIIALHHGGAFDQYFTQMWKGNEGEDKGNDRASLGEAHSVLLAPGTGLGTSVVLYDRLERRHHVMPLEFGHTSVQSCSHRDILRSYRRKLARGHFEVEYDDLCSGRGLEFLYRRIKGIDAKAASPTAGQVCSLASQGDRDALMTMRLYYTFLMRLASQLAMGICPRQIILLGDNMVKNEFYFNTDAVDAMHRTFRDHSMERLNFMSRVGAVRQTKFLNINLTGCAYVAEKQRLTLEAKL